MDEEFTFGEFVFALILAIYFIIMFTIEREKQKRLEKKREKEINFDEFTDMQKLKDKKITDKKTMEIESEKLKQVFNETYANAYHNAYMDAMNRGINLNSDDNINLRMEAMEAAERNANKYMDHLYKNKPGKIYEKEYLDGPILSTLRENGYNSDFELFKKWSRQIFGCIKSGTEEQLDLVKNFISDDLYAKLEKQKKMFEADGLEFVTEDLVIEKCNLFDYGKALSKEELKVIIQASMKEYIIQKATGVILKGDNSKTYTRKIIMTFVKKNIPDDEEGLIHNCPNCGSETHQTELGKCRYCDTLIFPIRYNWTLVKFETL